MVLDRQGGSVCGMAGSCSVLCMEQASQSLLTWVSAGVLIQRDSALN